MKKQGQFAIWCPATNSVLEWSRSGSITDAMWRYTKANPTCTVVKRAPKRWTGWTPVTLLTHG